MIRKLKNTYHFFIALFANLLHHFPSKNITIIGVTGTDGKTTTTNLIYHIIKTSGKNAAMISTIGAAIGNKTYDIGFHVTTPSSLALQDYIKRAENTGNNYLVLETTSHALDQNRVWGIHFSVGVLTNVTHEHLDYHKTYENYLATKAKLLLNSPLAIINKDDESYKALMELLKNKMYKGRIITYSLDSEADITFTKYPFKTSLFGDFNKHNCLAALATCLELGISLTDIKKALETFPTPIGRQQIVYDKNFTVMVDFAHTPNSFLKILPEVRKLTKGRLIHVFGAASLRDTTKRPFMGEASAKFSDIMVLTAEDPRVESVLDINKQIIAGIPKEKFEFIENISEAEFQKNKKYIVQIPDRKKAIEFAISIAQDGDFVITTGKSHEKSMNYGKGEEPWDEFEAIQHALKKRDVL